MKKRYTLDSNLQVQINYIGWGDDQVQIKLEDEDEMESIVIGEHQGEEGLADISAAIEDGIKNLKLMIARLEKMKAAKSVFAKGFMDKVNKTRSYVE